MKLIFSEQAWDDYLYWQSHDPKMLSRLNGLIRECSRTPFQGTGKPEPLRVGGATEQIARLLIRGEVFNRHQHRRRASAIAGNDDRLVIGRHGVDHR